VQPCNAACDGLVQPLHDQNAAYRAVVSDLVGLRLIEQTVARETSPEMSHGGPEGSTNIIVLDDVSLRYTKATTALQACDVGFDVTLRALLEVRGHASPENASGRLRRAVMSGPAARSASVHRLLFL
jgi:hypothetical protein